MTRKHHLSRPSDSRSGVALVIVLGLLVLITTLAIAFSIYMRTERQAAGNFKNDVIVHFLQRAALNTAIADLDNYFITSNVFHPTWLVYGGTGAVQTVTNMNVFAPAVLQYIPAELASVIATTAVQLVQSPLSTKSRSSYLIINCSGLLDPNYIGETNRLWGTNVQEIQLSQLPSIPSSLNATQFAMLRNTNYYRFETLQDVGSIVTTSPFIAFTQLPPEFADYSRSSLTNRIDLAGSVSNLTNRQSQITAGFVSAGFTTARAGILFTNLIDYVDSDFIPGNLGRLNGQSVIDGPYVEAAPMINEFKLTNYYRFVTGPGATNLATGKFIFSTEYFIPGTTVPSGSFTFNYSLVITNDPSAYPPTNFWPITMPAGTAPIGHLVKTNINIIFPQPIDYVQYMSLPFSAATSAVPFIVNADISFGLTGRLWVAWNGIPVDEVNNVNLKLLIPGNTIIVDRPLNTYNGASWGYQCVDPRINWNCSSLSQWKTNTFDSSFGKINNVTVAAFTNIFQGYMRDGDLDVYVANTPLHVVGELGYLLYDQPLETLRLYTHYKPLTNQFVAFHPVVDIFTVGGNAPIGARAQHGKVSLFSHASYVWKAVLGNMPLDFPHGFGTNRLLGAQLDTVINSILATNASFRSISDLGRVDWRALFPTMSEFDRESIIRNTSELLTNRQQYFIILITSQLTDSQWIAGTGETITSVKGSGSAIAEVWRDPFANTNNMLSNWFVRYFKVMD